MEEMGVNFIQVQNKPPPSPDKSNKFYGALETFEIRKMV